MSPDKPEIRPELNSNRESRPDLSRYFPELGNTEKGKTVAEAIGAILERNKLSSLEIKTLAPRPIEFHPRTFLDAEYQPDPTNPTERVLAAAGRGGIHIYDDYFNPAFDQADRAQIIGHELGELMQRQQVSWINRDRQLQTEHLVDINRYQQLVATRPHEWNDPYVRTLSIRLAERGHDRPYSELLADDIGDFLLSDSPEQMLTNRMHRIKKDTTFDESGLDQAVMLEETHAIYDFLTNELNRKKQYLGRSAEKEEINDYGSKFSFDQDSGIYGLPTAKYDSIGRDNFVHKLIDMIFGVYRK